MEAIKTALHLKSDNKGAPPKEPTSEELNSKYNFQYLTTDLY